MKRLGFALFLMAALPSFLSAQTADTCGDTETIPGCFGRIAEAVEVDIVADEVQQANALANTGVPTLSSPFGSSLKDFLSLFTASVDTATLSETDGGGLTLDWNFGAKQFTSGRPFKLQAVFEKPQLNSKVKSALSGELLQEKEGLLDDTDDASISLSYSPQRRSIGRTLSPHRPLFEVLLAAARAAEPPPTQTFNFLTLIQDYQRDAPFKDAAALDAVTFEQLTIEQRAEIEPAVIAAAHEQLKIDKAYQLALKAVGVDKFRELLHQQPQAYGSVLIRTRDELVGANETSFKLTYETSGRGLTNFYRDAERTCNDEQLSAARTASNNDAVDTCLTAWRDFLADDRTQAALAGSGRFAFSIEYAGTDENQIRIASPPGTVTPDPFTLKTESSESLIGSIAYGHTLAGGAREGRIDLRASYENVTGDADRDNRFVASAIYSQKVSDTLTIPIGIAYANRERYLEAVADRGISMHFGLVYKVPTLESLGFKSKGAAQ